MQCCLKMLFLLLLAIKDFRIIDNHFAMVDYLLVGSLDTGKQARHTYIWNIIIPYNLNFCHSLLELIQSWFSNISSQHNNHGHGHSWNEEHISLFHTSTLGWVRIWVSRTSELIFQINDFDVQVLNNLGAYRVPESGVQAHISTTTYGSVVFKNAFAYYLNLFQI